MESARLTAEERALVLRKLREARDHLRVNGRRHKATGTQHTHQTELDLLESAIKKMWRGAE